MRLNSSLGTCRAVALFSPTDSTSTCCSECKSSLVLCMARAWMLLGLLPGCQEHSPAGLCLTAGAAHRRPVMLKLSDLQPGLCCEVAMSGSLSLQVPLMGSQEHTRLARQDWYGTRLVAPREASGALYLHPSKLATNLSPQLQQPVATSP